MQQPLLFIILLLIASSSLSSVEARVGENGKKINNRRTKMDMNENRIVGGSFVGSPNTYPWFAQGNGCGGSLIAPDVVLTAAHCINAFKKGTNVRFKSLTYKKGGQARKVISVLKHPSYSPRTNSYDIMLLKIAPTSGIAPISLNSDANVPRAKQAVTVMGFGAINAAGNKYSKKLKHVSLKALSHAQCRKHHRNKITSPKAMMCAAAPRKDSCFGDSGGPLITATNPPVQVGIVSWGPTRCAVKSGVYSVVSGSYTWITQKMCELTDTNVCGSSPGDDTTGGGSTGGGDSTGGSTGDGGDSTGGGSSGSEADAALPVKFEMVVQYDQWPEETGIYILDAGMTKILVGKDFEHFWQSKGKRVYSIPVQSGTEYWLFLEDSFGNGFCCSEGKGFVVVRAKRGGNVIWSKRVSGKFGRDKVVNLAIPSF